MKKISILATMALAVALGFSSCDKASDKAANGSDNMDAKGDSTIVMKIDAKEPLSSDEYKEVIKYVGEYAKEAQKYIDLQNADAESAEAKEGMAKLNEKYPFYETYKNFIKNTPVSNFSGEDLQLINEYAGYTYFDMPAGMEFQAAPEDVAGFVEQSLPGDNGEVASVESVKVEERGF